MFYVYVLYNKLKDKIYVGHTVNLEKRTNQHNDPNFVLFGRNAYTKIHKGEWKLVYKESFKTRKEAKKREDELKSSRGRHFIRSQVLTKLGR